MSAGKISVTWALTGRCNYNCAHCYVSGPSGKLGELPTAESMALVDLLSDSGVTHISLTGGEPLLRPDFFEIARYMTERGITISQIATNGSLVDEAFIEKLLALRQRPRISISYDGDYGMHDALRGVSGASAAALHAFSLLSAAGFHTASEMTLHSGNAAVLRESILTLAAHGCMSVKVVPLFPVGAATQQKEYSPLPPCELFDVFLSYISDYYADDMPVELFLYGFFYAKRGISGFAVPMERFRNDACSLDCACCTHALEDPYISADGKLLPCAGLAGFPKLCADFPRISDAGFAGAHECAAFSRFLNHTVREQLRNNNECAACESRFMCGGGCRIVPLSANEGFSGKDAYCCEFYKNGWKARIQGAIRIGKLKKALSSSATDRA